MIENIKIVLYFMGDLIIIMVWNSVYHMIIHHHDDIYLPKDRFRNDLYKK